MAAPGGLRVVFAEVPRVPSQLVDRLRARGVRIEHIAQADEEAIDPSLAVVVIGPGVAQPATLARRWRARGSPLHFVFIASPQGSASLRHALLFSAPAGTPWTLVPEEGPAIERAVDEALDTARRGMQVRTTLDRLNLRLAAAEPHEPADYRRLVASDQYLASILRSVPDAILSVSASGIVLSWNDGARRMLGTAPGQAVGAPLSQLARWSSDLLPFVHAAMRERFVRTELRVESGSGPLLLDATFSSIEQQPSEVMAVAVIMRDITERKRTEEALARSEMQFRALADNITQLAWMADGEGAIFWYNRRWFEFTGTTLEQMRGWGWRSVHHPDHVERVAAKFRAHIEAQVPWEDTFPLRSHDGGYRWFLSRAVPLRDAAGRITNWFGTNTDITSEREAQQALREADRRKDEFISMLSHELRNPLAPIGNSIFLLEHAGGDAAAARRAREVISRQTRHLARLVDDLLDVTRISRGKIELVRARSDVASVVRAAVEDYRDAAAGAGLSLSLDGTEAPLHADIDGARIAQVLGNLLSNAIKFTPRGGRIAVSSALEGHTIRIDVADTGYGIDQELLPQLFEPFVQGDRTLARSQGGLGLGLSLARGIVELHEGRLSAQSAGRDQGATFTVWLPAAREPAPPARPVEARHSQLQETARRVLVVDDNRDAADSLAQLVRLFGHDADVAYDGPTALVLARHAHPDVVLCDIGLPGMDGYEVARRLRAEMQAVRVFAVSGYAQPADLAAAVRAGFEGHVAKPPRPEEIRRIIQAG